MDIWCQRCFSLYDNKEGKQVSYLKQLISKELQQELNINPGDSKYWLLKILKMSFSEERKNRIIAELRRRKSIIVLAPQNTERIWTDCEGCEQMPRKQWKIFYYREGWVSTETIEALDGGRFTKNARMWKYRTKIHKGYTHTRIKS